MTKLQLFILVVSNIFFAACTSSTIPMVSQNPMYKLGQEDGCSTANGTYTKSRENFRNNTEYANGWFDGRKNCNPINAKK